MKLPAYLQHYQLSESWCTHLQTHWYGQGQRCGNSPVSIPIACRSFTVSFPADACAHKRIHRYCLESQEMQQDGNVSVKSQINAPEGSTSHRISILCIFPEIRDAFKNFCWPSCRLGSFSAGPLVAEIELFCRDSFFCSVWGLEHEMVYLGSSLLWMCVPCVRESKHRWDGE